MTTPNKAGIYIHVPFCVKKCNYCAFLSGPAGPEVRQEDVNHLIEEIRLRSREVPEADTIYFGGGTPSLLTPEQIGHILEEVRKAFWITKGAEVTLEANPGTLTEESLAGYGNAGINRLSMGVQSMDDRRLRYLGRIHTAEEVRRDVKMAQEAGFHNINLDLIFAIPGTDVSDAMEDLEATGNIARALGLVNIHLLDHFILTDTEYFSMRDANRLPIYDFKTGTLFWP